MSPCYGVEGGLGHPKEVCVGGIFTECDTVLVARLYHSKPAQVHNQPAVSGGGELAVGKDVTHKAVPWPLFRWRDYTLQWDSASDRQSNQ